MPPVEAAKQSVGAAAPAAVEDARQRSAVGVAALATEHDSPDDLLAEPAVLAPLLAALPAETLQTAACVSRAWADAVSVDKAALWRALVLGKWPGLAGLSSADVNWQKRYRVLAKCGQFTDGLELDPLAKYAFVLHGSFAGHAAPAFSQRATVRRVQRSIGFADRQLVIKDALELEVTFPDGLPLPHSWRADPPSTDADSAPGPMHGVGSGGAADDTWINTHAPDADDALAAALNPTGGSGSSSSTDSASSSGRPAAAAAPPSEHLSIDILMHDSTLHLVAHLLSFDIPKASVHALDMDVPAPVPTMPSAVSTCPLAAFLARESTPDEFSANVSVGASHAGVGVPSSTGEREAPPWIRKMTEEVDMTLIMTEPPCAEVLPIHLRFATVHDPAAGASVGAPRAARMLSLRFGVACRAVTIAGVLDLPMQVSTIPTDYVEWA